MTSTKKVAKAQATTKPVSVPARAKTAKTTAHDSAWQTVGKPKHLPPVDSVINPTPAESQPTPPGPIRNSPVAPKTSVTPMTSQTPANSSLKNSIHAGEHKTTDTKLLSIDTDPTMIVLREQVASAIQNLTSVTLGMQQLDSSSWTRTPVDPESDILSTSTSYSCSTNSTNPSKHRHQKRRSCRQASQR